MNSGMMPVLLMAWVQALDAATGAELAAYDSPSYIDRLEAAYSGVATSHDLISGSQNLLAVLGCA